jgi:soluble lytic murein transglycosylase-like protein
MSGYTGKIPTATNTTVTRWKPYAEQAGTKYGIPADVLLALIDEESGGNPGETSPTGAKGITQFEPAAAATYHVNTEPGGEYSQVMGAGAYLQALGFSSNPTKALASYNAGPANWQAGLGYASAVLAKAKEYGGANVSSAAPAAATNSTTASTGNPLVPEGRGSGTALTDLTYVLLFVIGAGLLYVGITRAAGRRPAGGSQ